MHVHKAMHAPIVLLSYDLKFMDHTLYVGTSVQGD